MLDVAPLTATIGAEVTGVDLAEDLDEAMIEEVRNALLEWKVLFFRDQHDATHRVERLPAGEARDGASDGRRRQALLNPQWQSFEVRHE